MPSIIEIITSTLLIAYLAEARFSVMYAHDKMSDVVAKKCMEEMFPKAKHMELQESDEPCIIFCVLRKLGIMAGSGVINLEAFRQRVLMAQHAESRNLVSDLGSSCMDRAEATHHKQDVCKKAKTFNDCTRLYKIMLL